MPQAWLPLIPSGATQINETWSVENKNERWFYFCGLNPVFSHAEDDRKTFRMFSAQLVYQGQCKQSEIVRTFGVSRNSVNRSLNKYQEGGANAFFAPRKGRGGSVLTDVVKKQAQELLFSGETKKEVAKKLGIKHDTLRKAISQGRLIAPNATISPESLASNKSVRSFEDASAEIGIACTRPFDRLCAAIGRLPGGAQTRFESCLDVTFGGVLCALPALIASGLLSHVDKCFKTLSGYYTTLQVLILMAQMALCRIKTVEQLQYHCPGELGKTMGLDRVPEVRCLRKKLAELSEDNAPEKWSKLLCSDWMEASCELAGALYIDGHVRVYHGGKTKLPKRFVSRERLCLRGTTEYWINDALGQPFFVVNRPVDREMLEALRADIVPRLLKDVPGQPSKKELENNPFLHRFVMIFDREGYSPAFFKEMWKEHRIGCITYHKFPKGIWPEKWFKDTEVKMPSGEVLTMKLAEMGTWIGDKKNGLWVREVRKLNKKSDHQTSLISSAVGAIATENAALIFSRWSQENFFAYMTKHYALDLLSEYGTEEFPGTQQVVNPVWRKLDRQSRSIKSKLTNRRARYAALDLHPEMEDKKVAKWRQKKAELVEEIEHFENDLVQIKEKLGKNPKHIDWHDMKDDDKFERLRPSRKQLTDTIKMIAYRAETALVNTVREKLSRKDDARSLIRDLCNSEADILPDIKGGILNIRVHSMANPRYNQSIEHLLIQLNESEFNYPGTTLKMHFTIAASPNSS